MLVAALVVVLGLLWTLTSFAPNFEENREFKKANSNFDNQVVGGPTLGASVSETYGVEPPPAPPYVRSF